eukprot:1354759-Rhodomonas_salina.1
MEDAELGGGAGTGQGTEGCPSDASATGGALGQAGAGRFRVKRGPDSQQVSNARGLPVPCPPPA